MKKYTLFLLLSFLFPSIDAVSQPVKMAIISDIHYLSPEMAQPGAALEKYEAASGRNVSDLHAVLDKTLAEIEAAGTDILLVTGDLTNHGERQSHLDFAEKLQPILQAGIRIFVIPGNHDVNVPDAKHYAGDSVLPTEPVSPQEFAEIYADFGYAGALRRDSTSLSYLATLADSVWLLCIDSNRWSEYRTSSISGGRILPATMDWALDILREAKAKNITVLGMMHHGLVEHMPYQSAFFADYLISDWEKNAGILADAGLQVVFTGHFHANDATRFVSDAGNPIYDIETGSLAQYPFPYRLISFDGKSLSVNTRFVGSVSGKPNLQEEYRAKMEAFARKAIPAKLRNLGFSFPADTQEALTNLLAHIMLLHVCGDEDSNGDTMPLIKNLAEILDSEEFDTESFRLDFPPEDNHLKITLK